MGWPGDHIVVDIALSDAPYVIVPTWTAVPDIYDLTWNYTRDGATGQCWPSTCTFTADNQDGKWDPSTGLGGAPWAGNIQRWLKVRVVCGGTRRFRGHIVDVRCETTNRGAIATITAVDQLGILAEHNLEDLVRPEELAGTRITAILDAVGLPAGLSSREDVGTVVLAAATLSGQALAAAQECARAEGGHLWCKPAIGAGDLMSTDRHYLYDTATLNGFTLADDDIEQVAVPQTLASFDNVAVGASSGTTGTVYTYGSPATNFPASTRREMATSAAWDADASTTAEWLQRHGNFSGTRVETVVCSVLHGSDTTVLDGIVAGTLQWMDTVTIQFTPVHGSAVNQTCWVESETHRVSRDGTWILTLGLSPYATDYANFTDPAWTFGAVMATGLDPGV